MKFRSLALATAAGALMAACDQASQQLPFDSTADQPVTRSLPAEGGTISSNAGATVALPAGALSSATTLTVTPLAAASSESGAPAGTTAFRIDPDGLALGQPAAVDVAVDRSRADAWLAALVVESAAGVDEIGEGSVDVTSGIARGEIGRLGKVTAMIPEAAAILRARPLGTAPRLSTAPASAAVAQPTKALRGGCGERRNRCGELYVEVSPNLLAMVDTVAVVFPRVGGEIRISGATATGALTLHAPVRVRLSSRTNAVTVPSRITAEATPQTVVTETTGRVTLTNVRIRGRSAQQDATTTGTLTVDYQGAKAWVRLNHTFTATLGSGQPEQVTVAAQVPLSRAY